MRMTPLGAGLIAIEVIVVTLLVTFAIIILVVRYENSRFRMSPTFATERMTPTATKTLRVRSVNTNVLPIPVIVNPKKVASKAIAAGVFSDVDVVLLQEAFRRFDRKDFLAELCKQDPRLRAAVTEGPTPKGKFTDSGLAVVTVHPYDVRFIANHTFGFADMNDKRSAKGVSVFEVNTVPPTRFAVVHLQSTPTFPSEELLSKQENIRRLQFREAVAFSEKLGAAVIAGDVNTTRSEEYTAIVQEFTDGEGQYVQHDGLNTCCKPLLPFFTKKASHYERVDHAWVLRPKSRASVVGKAKTREDLSDSWTDHACIEFAIEIHP